MASWWLPKRTLRHRGNQRPRRDRRFAPRRDNDPIRPINMTTSPELRTDVSVNPDVYQCTTVCAYRQIRQFNLAASIIRFLASDCSPDRGVHASPFIRVPFPQRLDGLAEDEAIACPFLILRRETPRRRPVAWGTSAAGRNGFCRAPRAWKLLMTNVWSFARKRTC